MINYISTRNKPDIPVRFSWFSSNENYILSGWFLVPEINKDQVIKDIVKMLKEIPFLKTNKKKSLDFNSNSYKIEYKFYFTEEKWKLHPKENIFLKIIEYIETLDYTREVNEIEEEF
jgi:hypothetical protein